MHLAAQVNYFGSGIEPRWALHCIFPFQVCVSDVKLGGGKSCACVWAQPCVCVCVCVCVRVRACVCVCVSLHKCVPLSFLFLCQLRLFFPF